MKAKEFDKKFESGEVEKSQFSSIYHFSNEGVTSWYDFAMAIFEIRNIKVKVNAIETKDYPTPAKRPPFSVLNKGKIKKTFGVEVPHWRKSLKECLELLPKTGKNADDAQIFRERIEDFIKVLDLFEEFSAALLPYVQSKKLGSLKTLLSLAKAQETILDRIKCGIQSLKGDK